MDEKDVVLKVSGLKVRYKVGRRRVNAVNGVSFELGRQTTLGIVGESGCGKSATAHSILQLLPKNGLIESGSVTYYPQEGDPVVITDHKRTGKAVRAIRGKEIAMIFQDPLSSLNPVYTIGAQIEEALLAHEKISKAEARRRAVELLARLGIPKPELRIKDYPHQFSGGMKQRVMIAMAMICHPRILIADEPTTALDVTIQAQILELMQELQQEYGTSTILITHNMGIVAEVCDAVAVMYMGRVVEYGTLEQVFTNPLHPYTKALMRSVPVLGMEKDRVLETIEGNTPDATLELKGCAFCDRCTQATPQCALRMPQETQPQPGHRVSCLLYEGGENR